MMDLAFLFLIAVYAYWLGRQVLRHLGYEFTTGAGQLSAATGLGLGLVAYAILGLGLTGWLNLAGVLCAAALLVVFVHVPWLAARVPPRSCIGGNFPTPIGVEGLRPQYSVLSASSLANNLFPRPPHTGAEGTGRIGSIRLFSLTVRPARLFQTCLLVIACAGTLVSALAPPTAGDALCYHLEIPKRFVQLGETRYLPLTDNSAMPFLMEMLYTLGLLLRGPELAQLMHWLVGVLLALAVVELAEPLVGRAGAAWAATVALLVPGFTNQMTAPLNDLAVALYTTLMLVAWARWHAVGQRRWLALAGVFGGLALSVKLVAAAMVVVLSIAIAVGAWRRHGWRGVWRAGAVFGVTLCLSGGIWYARSWYHTGNPVYPYFNAWFGGEPHTPSTLRTAHDLLAVPWAATMHPEEFGGRGVQFGAVFLALVPGLLLIPNARRLRPLLALALGYGLLWFAIRQDLRFLLPIVPILAVAVACVIRGLRGVHRPAFVSAAGCLAGLLIFQTLVVVKRARPCVAVALGMESREAYLDRHEPSYRVAQFANTQLPSGSRLISQDYRGLYFQPEFVREESLRRRTPYHQRGRELVDLLTTNGFTHVLLVQAYNPETAVYEQEFTERLGGAVEDLSVVFTAHFEGPGGDRRDYRLLELPRGGFRVQGSGFRVDAN